MSIFNVQMEDSDGNIYTVKPDLLTTKEQLSANNKVGKTVDALVIKEINNNLNSHPQFIYDESGRIIGYKTVGGADTVFPFRTGNGNTGATFLAEMDSAMVKNELYYMNVKTCQGFDVDDGQHIVTCKEAGGYKIQINCCASNVNSGSTIEYGYVINDNQCYLCKIGGVSGVKDMGTVNLEEGDKLSMYYKTAIATLKAYTSVFLTKIE